MAPCARTPACSPAAAPRTSSPFATRPPTRTCGGPATSRSRRNSSKRSTPNFIKHAEGMTLFAQDLYGGADPALRIKTRVFTELAWHSLFIRTLLIRPETSELASFVPELTIIDLPSFKADPKRHGVRSENVVAIDFARKIVLIGGSYYAGEMKKSVFTTLNYYLPAKGRDADALFGQCRARRRCCDLLRPVRHRQDHALGRPGTHADRRRRARLGPGRHLQFRRRLLRQMHQAVGGSRARDLCRQQALRRGAGERGARRQHPRARFRRRLENRKHPLGLSARFHPQRLAQPAAPVIRRIW